MIQGRVCIQRAVGRSEGLSGVRVSNGREVAQTDAEGAFLLPRKEEDRFVFVTVPAGYASVGPFYRDLAQSEACGFVLREDAAGLDADFSFVQITDIHMAVEGRTGVADLKADLAQIYGEAGREARFIAATGDLTNIGTEAEYALYLEAVQTSKLPMWHCIGNHDDNANPKQERGDEYMAALGPTYYSFDYGPLHFVVYDPVGRAWRHPDHQSEWLRADMKAAARPTVMLIHYPWGREFYDGLKTYDIVATLSGHWHSSRVFRDGGTVHYNTPTLCFGGIDQSPRGYRLCTYRNGVFSAVFRALDSKNGFRGIGAMPHPAAEARTTRTTGLAPEPREDWPMFGGNAQRTGAARSGPTPPLSLAWRTGTGGGMLMASPVLGAGRIFVGVKREDRADGNALLALDAQTGAILWECPVASGIKLAPAFDAGRVFVVTVTGEVLAADAASGRSLWRYQLGDPSQRWVYMSPLVCEGRVFAGMTPHFAALDAGSGEPVWVREGMGKTDWIGSYPSPVQCGPYLVLAFYGQPTYLWMMEAGTGRTVWHNEADKSFRVNATPVAGPDGAIFVVSGASLVRAIDVETRAVKWETPLKQTRCASSPALSGNRLFVPTGGGTLHALDPDTGRELWTWQGGAGLASFTPYVRGGPGVTGSPVVNGRVVYLGSADGHLYGLDADTGAQIWRHDLGMPTLSTPAVSGTGLWTCACDGFVYAFGQVSD